MGCINDKDSSKPDKKELRTISTPKPLVIFILGGPGSGKGTLCDQLVSRYSFLHYSTGDLLRKEQENHPESDLSKSIQTCMVEGKLVSSEILIDILKKNIEGLKDKQNTRILLDGFPRNQENIDVWKKKKMDDIVDVKFVLYLECGFATMEKRILGRAQASGAQKRADDSPETIKKRFDTFENQTKPIVEYYQKEGKIVKVNAETDPESVFNECGEKFKEHGIEKK